jgi:hypothetical protein
MVDALLASFSGMVDAVRLHPPGEEMPLCDHSSPDLRRSSKSRLSETLLRLQNNLNETRRSEASAESQFDAWQERWSDHREQISRRLELIDVQLEALVRSRQVRPQLSLVGRDG